MFKGKQSKQADIRKKLAQSNITAPQQFQQIISNLINQRERLQNDLRILRQKVVALQQKQAQKQFSKTIRKKISPGKKQINYRDELNKKYEELKQWQKRSLKAAKNSPVQVQYRIYFEKLLTIQQQIQITLKQLNEEYATSKKLKKALRLINKDQQINHNAHQGIQRENKLLKKRVFSLRKIVDRQLDKQMELQNYLVDIKEKQRQVKEKELQDKQRQNRQRQSRQRKQRLKKQKERQQRQIKQRDRRRTQEMKSSRTQEESDQIIDYQISMNQIVSKEEVYQVQGRLNRIQKKYRSEITQLQNKIKKYPYQFLSEKRQGSKLTFAKQFQILLQKVKTNLNCLNEVNKRKIKIFLQSFDKNYFDQQIKSQRGSNLSILIRNKNSSINKRRRTHGNQTPFYKPRIKSVTVIDKFQEKVLYPKVICSDEYIQTDYFDYFGNQQLRRQFIGKIDQHRFFDRKLLGQQINCSIKTLQIYYSNRGIATIKAKYNHHKSKDSKQSQLIIPASFISNYCKVHVIDTNHDDFIRYFKIRYHLKDNRITQIKIVTNRGVKNGWGDAKIKGEEIELDQQIQKEIVFDINQNEYPVSIFCSHVQKGPYWYLCGFGVEINDL